MPIPRSLKRLALRALLQREDYVRVMRAEFGDAGHGYDPLGLSAEDFAFAMALAFPFYAHYFRVRSYGADRWRRLHSVHALGGDGVFAGRRGEREPR